MLSDVYLFNPTNELAIANGDPNYMPPRRLFQFEKELSTLPMFFASGSDVVLVAKIPSPAFIAYWQETGKEIPRFLREEEALEEPVFLQEPKGSLNPWGWSPAVHKRLASLKESCSPAFKNSPMAHWRAGMRDLYSRKAAAGILMNLLKNAGTNDWLLPENDTPVVCFNLGEITRLQSGSRKLVVKSPWSASGRGIQMLRANELNQSNRQVISGFIRQQGYVMVEPFLNKVADVSLQFYSEGEGTVDFRGQSSFLTDTSGRYQGNYIEELPPGLSEDETRFLKEHLPIVRHLLEETLSGSDFTEEYRGWLGVDLLLYRDEINSLRIHPCLEINCRYNMGALTLQLRDLISPESTGQWAINYGQPGEVNREMKAQMLRSPVHMADGKMVSGILPMIPPADDSSFSVWLNVEHR
jgi:hypothetical protein